MAVDAQQAPARAVCNVAWLGTDVDYEGAWALQRRLAVERAEGRRVDTLLLLEHAPVYTAGRRSLPEHVLGALDAPFVETDRGGQLTYHGPGQLVGYPIVSLPERRMGPRQYVRCLEQVLLGVLGDFGVSAHLEEGLTGVWTAGGKVGAIGVKVSRGVTMHGFALNVTTDLRAYASIVPCGIAGRPVTSMSQELGTPVVMEDVRQAIVRQFARVFSWGPRAAEAPLF